MPVGVVKIDQNGGGNTYFIKGVMIIKDSEF